MQRADHRLRTETSAHQRAIHVTLTKAGQEAFDFAKCSTKDATSAPGITQPTRLAASVLFQTREFTSDAQGAQTGFRELQLRLTAFDLGKIVESRINPNG